MTTFPRKRRSLRGDDGQLLLLVLGYVVVAALLVTVVVAVSTVFLHRRALVAAADAAALVAANQPDLTELYRGTSSGQLPLSEAAAREAVEQYAVDARLSERFRDFLVVAVTVEGPTVTVTVRAVVPLPIVNRVTTEHRGGHPITATASARSPLSP